MAESQLPRPRIEGPLLKPEICAEKTKSYLGKRKHDEDYPISAPQSAPGLEVAMGSEEGRMSNVEQANNSDMGLLSLPSDAEVSNWNTPEARQASLCSVDGVNESGRRTKPDITAIFIHAGAGYHSTANEKIHLEACSDAARAAMKLLKEGYSAIEGVEAAIKVLEDKEITNAGFGSNLAVDGTVECDATLVDHLGRSGACGAVPNIKNPISLAKLILQESHKPLTLRRVPPNLLVGKGAKDFAWEHGMPLVPNEWLVSRNAKDRYMRWKDDLDHADTKATAATNIEHRVPDADYNEEIRYKKNQRDHANAIATGTWNEGQPDSPAQPATPSENSSSAMQLGSPLKSGTLSTQGPSSPRAPKAPGERSPLSFLGSLGSPRASSPGSPGPGSPVFKIMRHSGGRRAEAAVSGNNSADQTDVREKAASPISLVRPGSPRKCALQASEDRITDTVGAIAIDQRGDMAAGSSSGGIGMKHRGRVGPAALVGIGTAIIPANADDEDRLVVGAVTSGTGEHMATTQASQRCAERLYHGTRRGIDGRDVEEPEESVVMESFITHDFQNHPGVLQSSSSSAIGAMAVKQTRNGYYLYFAHNTDSFALASMSSTDRNPNCVMSRLPEGSTGVAQGARKIRVE